MNYQNFSDAKEVVSDVAKIIGETMGAKGNTIYIQQPGNQHILTKDGYTVLKHITSSDNLSKTVLDLLTTVSYHLVSSVGDGSSSAILITDKLLDSLEYYKKHNPLPSQDIKTALHIVISELENELLKSSNKVNKSNISKVIKRIADISLDGDIALVKLLVKVFKEVDDGNIVLEEGNNNKTTYEISNGLSINQGMASPVFSNDLSNDIPKARYISPHVVLIKNYLLPEHLNFINNQIKLAATSNKPCVFLCNGICSNFLANITKFVGESGESPAVMFINVKDKDSINFDSLSSYMAVEPVDLNDAATYPLEVNSTTKVISATMGKTYIIVNDNDEVTQSNEAFMSRLDSMIQEELDSSDNTETLLVKKLRLLKAKHSGKAGKIIVGGLTKQDRTLFMTKLEDGISAIKSAIVYGYVPAANTQVCRLLTNNEQLVERIVNKIVDETSLHNRHANELIVQINNAYLETYKSLISKGIVDEYVNNEENTLDGEKLKELLDSGKSSLADVVTNELNKRSEHLTSSKEATENITGNTIYNIRTGEREDINRTVVINSVKTDIEILRGALTLVGNLISSKTIITIPTY